MKKFTPSFNEFLNEARQETALKNVLKTLASKSGLSSDFQVQLTLPEPKTDMSNYGFNVDDVVKVEYYGFDSKNDETPYSLEVIYKSDGSLKYQIWYDASPVVSGDSRTLDADYVDSKELTSRKFIKKLKDSIAYNDKEAYDDSNLLKIKATVQKDIRYDHVDEPHLDFDSNYHLFNFSTRDEFEIDGRKEFLDFTIFHDTDTGNIMIQRMNDGKMKIFKKLQDPSKF